MSQKLPPLNALVFFEAVAKHLSFTAAAQEICVTQGAVSQQIKKLEEFLGVQLFIRVHQGLLLTTPGTEYLPAVTEALDRIRIATAAFVSKVPRGVLSVNASPNFANKWLVPKFHRFYKRYPDIDLRISATPVRTEFGKEDIDIAIRCGRGPWPGVDSTQLTPERIHAVCSPELLKGDRPLTTLDNLIHYPLLRNADQNLWPQWLQAANLEPSRMQFGPMFNMLYMTIQAAINGQGVALASSTLVAEDIAAGRLVTPFMLQVPAPDAYWFVCPRSKALEPKVAAFKSWLFSEIEQEATYHN
jgi:LysR family glycine cleavage system transcriptional activator